MRPFHWRATQLLWSGEVLIYYWWSTISSKSLSPLIKFLLIENEGIGLSHYLGQRQNQPSIFCRYEISRGYLVHYANVNFYLLET
jgi:hypothetical protein